MRLLFRAATLLLSTVIVGTLLAAVIRKAMS